MNKHTPGPWEVTFGENNGLHEFCVHSDVTICRGNDEAIGWEANARLIAAAPELLEALESIIEPLPDKWGYGAASNVMNDAIRSKAIAAIAKAKGEPT